MYIDNPLQEDLPERPDLLVGPGDLAQEIGVCRSAAAARS